MSVLRGTVWVHGFQQHAICMSYACVVAAQGKVVDRRVLSPQEGQHDKKRAGMQHAGIWSGGRPCLCSSVCLSGCLSVSMFAQGNIRTHAHPHTNTRTFTTHMHKHIGTQHCTARTLA